MVNQEFAHAVKEERDIVMNRDVVAAQLVDRIKDYRRGELEFIPDIQHVNKWLSQFSPENQETILYETVHLFDEWYLTNEYIDEKVDRIPNYLQYKYGYKSIYEMCDAVSFLDIQKDGQSQHAIISRLSERLFEKYGIYVKTKIEKEISHYIYFDDGLYTGSRARKELREIILCLPPNSTLEVFYIVVCSSAFLYTKKILLDYAQKKGINLRMHHWKTIYNDKTTSWNTDGSVESWNIRHDCLWPSPSLKTNEEIRTYIERLQGLSKGAENYLFRKEHWENDAGIFTSIEGRNIVETEFLLQGIRILNKVSGNNGIYPLGYNLFPSLGLGTFCVFDMNISNTCPLVLWWGNNEPKENVLDSWYPLFPRRVNASGETNHSIEDSECWEKINPIEQYNMCPDCGKYFRLEMDGANGFCNDCAWNH